MSVIKTKQKTQMVWGGVLGFWRPRRGRKSGPEARVSGPRKGPEIGPGGAGNPGPGGAGNPARRAGNPGPRRSRASGPTPFFSLPHSSPLFLPLLCPFLLFKVSRPTSKSDPLRGSQLFDLFARVGRRGLRDRLFLGPERGSPLYVAKKS